MPNKTFFKLIQPLLLLVFMPFFSMAQDSLTVKLISALDTVKIEAKKVDILIELVEVTTEFSIDSANVFLDSAEQISKRINYKHGLAEVEKARGAIYSMEGDYANALRASGKALTMFRQLQDTLKLAKTYLLLGNIYVSTNNNSEALRYYRNASNLFGIIKNHKSLAGVNNNIGIIYWRKGLLDSASMFFNKALLTYMELNDKESLATSYTNIGIIYAENKKIQKAISYYEKSNATLIQLNQTYGQAINNLNIGDAYMRLKEYDKATKHVKIAISIAEFEGYKSLLADQYYTVGEIEEAKGDYKKAIKWYRKSEQIEDSLFDSETNVAMMEVQSKQLEEIQQREIEKIQQINEGALNTAKLKNTLLLVVSGFILVLLLVASTYFYKRARVARQINNQNLQILSQKSKIYQQAKAIADKNEALLEKNAKLEELNEEKNYIMNVVAHDLKSPLNQIQGLAEVIRLEEGTLSSTQQECLSNISTSSERLSMMINRILNTRAIESDNLEYQASNVKVGRILHQIVGNFQPLADQKNISILTSGVVGSPSVKGDKHHIQQVIENLISNAIKFSPPSKKVEIALKIEDKRAVLSFKDEGPGLTKDDFDKLFVEYANLSAQPTGDETSTGLGLSIVKKYVELMEGEIWCKSTFGHGATFFLAFNLA